MRLRLTPFCEEIVRAHEQRRRRRKLRGANAMRTMILGKGWRQDA
jgi:hypothetical protein